MVFLKKLKLGWWLRYKGMVWKLDQEKGKAWPSNYAWIVECVGHVNLKIIAFGANTMHVASMLCLDYGLHLPLLLHWGLMSDASIPDQERVYYSAAFCESACASLNISFAHSTKSVRFGYWFWLAFLLLWPHYLTLVFLIHYSSLLFLTFSINEKLNFDNKD